MHYFYTLFYLQRLIKTILIVRTTIILCIYIKTENVEFKLCYVTTKSLKMHEKLDWDFI